jgi:hypothetical protein
MGAKESERHTVLSSPMCRQRSGRPLVLNSLPFQAPHLPDEVTSRGFKGLESFATSFFSFSPFGSKALKTNADS